jgi:hypothetical protein
VSLEMMNLIFILGNMYGGEEPKIAYLVELGASSS